MTLRVLLIEGSEEEAALLTRELERGGYEPVSERVESPDALEAALREGEWELLVLSDDSLPGLGAPEALKMLREETRDPPFIVVSEEFDEERVVEALRAGARDFITRENLFRLNPAIERQLQEEATRYRHRQAEAALRRTEKRFRRLFEQAADAIFVHDLEGRFVDINRQACESLGYSREELLGLSVLDIEMNYAPGALAWLWEQVSSGTPRTLEGIHRRKDGTTFPTEVSVGVLEEEEGRLMLAVVRDVTERHRAEEALRKSESRLAEAQRIAHIGNWDYDVAADEAYWSDELYRIFGFEPQEFVPGYKSFLRLVHPGDRGIVQEAIRRAASGSSRSSTEYRIVCPDGEVRAVSTEYEPVLDGSGRMVRMVRMVGTIQDVTERWRAVEALKIHARQQEAVARLGRQALTSTNLQTLMEEAVELVANTLEVEYCKVLELLPDERRLLLRAGVGWREGLVGQATVGAGLDSQAGYTLASDGPVIVEDLRTESRFSGPPLLREHGVVSGMSAIIRGRERPFGVLGAHTTERRTFTADDVNFLRAITNVLAEAIERKRAEDAMHQTREAERSRIAHDLHDDTLQELVYALQEIQVFQALSEDAAPDLEPAAEALRRSVEGLRESIFELRMEESSGVSIAETVHALVDLNRRMARGAYELELMVADEFPEKLSARAARELVQILKEALNNVRRHAQASRVEVSLRVEEEVLVAEVVDDGKGFEPARAQRGVGSHSMRERAAALGGELAVRSSPGCGTRVRVQAPLERCL